MPSGRDGHRLFNVPYGLAIPIIEMHIAAQKAEIAILSAKAATELGRPDDAEEAHDGR